MIYFDIVTTALVHLIVEIYNVGNISPYPLQYLEANSVNINKAKGTITTSPDSVGYVPWVTISR